MNNSICPGCNRDVGRVALVNLVYTFEENKENLLVETAWHKQCFIEAEQKAASAAGKERIEITREACAALRSFLMNDREGTGEGYSDFILRAIELRREQAA